MIQDETNIRERYTRSYISNAVFYIPFAYYYAVRLGTVPKLLSWLLLYLMPTAFYSAWGYSGAWSLFAANYLLILLATFSLYEFGYIYNDTRAIRYEEFPAIRLYRRNFLHFERWHVLILGLRALYAAAALYALYMLNADNERCWYVVAAIVAMCLFFGIYNRWRNKYNVWFYPLLVCSRYVPFLLLYETGWLPYLMLFLAFPCVNALERFSMPRYRWPIMRRFIPDEASKTRFRVVYYLLTLILTTTALYGGGQSLWLVFPIGILFVYRLALLVWVRRHTPENYLNG